MFNWDHKKLTVGEEKKQQNNLFVRTQFEMFYISQLIKLYYSKVESRFSDTAAMNRTIKKDWKTIKTHFNIIGVRKGNIHPTPTTVFPIPKMNCFILNVCVHLSLFCIKYGEVQAESQEADIGILWTYIILLHVCWMCTQKWMETQQPDCRSV